MFILFRVNALLSFCKSVDITYNVSEHAYVSTSCTAHNFYVYISSVDEVWAIVMKVCRHRLCKLESHIVVKQRWPLL